MTTLGTCGYLPSIDDTQILYVHLGACTPFFVQSLDRLPDPYLFFLSSSRSNNMIDRRFFGDRMEDLSEDRASVILALDGNPWLPKI